ncbi:MAG: hydroxymethylglutaryl-CoA lyase, partial [Actinobacteria bacterium]|nr:hydroxymethylglutaryl-CoA lyase [Actinomycetota bacterium]
MSRITIVEVGPRDGLQNEAVVVDTDTKVEFIAKCVAAGVQRIEAASFVNPKRVPQMADGEAVLAQLPPDAASYIGLVLNE